MYRYNVATSDNALSLVVRCNGAYAISAGSLVEELTRARAAETEILRDLAVKARWGGDKRGNGMVTRDSETADKLMALYLAAPSSSTAKFSSKTGGFSSKPKKGKKNKGGKKQPGGGEVGGGGEGGDGEGEAAGGGGIESA